jgi:hypothetical protein
MFDNKYSNLGGGINFWFLTWKEELLPDLTIFPTEILSIFTLIFCRYVCYWRTHGQKQSTRKTLVRNKYINIDL